MRRTDRNEVFKKNVLKRLYPASESDDSVTGISTDIESDRSHDPSLKLARLPQGRVYTVTPAPTVDGDEGHVITTLAADKQHPTSEDHGTLTKAISSRLHTSSRTKAVTSKIDVNIYKEADGSTLTKNQKRKLKKKRRKEKLKQIDTGKEFIFHNNSEKAEPKSEATCTDSFADKQRKDVAEFFESIWEIYSAQCKLQHRDADSAEKRVQLSTLLGSISDEDSDNYDLQLLAEAKSSLVSNDQQKFLHLKSRLQSELSLGKDIGNLIVMLCEFWINDIS